MATGNVLEPIQAHRNRSNLIVQILFDELVKERLDAKFSDNQQAHSWDSRFSIAAAIVSENLLEHYSIENLTHEQATALKESELCFYHTCTCNPKVNRELQAAFIEKFGVPTIQLPHNRRLVDIANMRFGVPTE